MIISQLVVGSNVNISLLVKTSENRKTKAPGNKPYLFLELTDGVDTIQGNHWDWGPDEGPAKNTVVDVTTNVTEYMGNKQLNIKSLKQNTELGVELFAPKGDVKIVEYMEKAKVLMSTITNAHARDIVWRILKDNQELWKVVPAAKSVHHAFVAGTLKHSVDVTEKAIALSRLMPNCNDDLVIAGALVHDFGKLWTYEIVGALIDFTDDGCLLDHVAIGIARIEQYRTPENSAVLTLMQHIIASHHGKLEYGAPATPRFLEAWCVSYADGMDAKAQTITEANAKCKPGDKMTAKEWTLENRAMFTQEYIASIMK